MSFLGNPVSGLERPDCSIKGYFTFDFDQYPKCSMSININFDPFQSMSKEPFSICSLNQIVLY